MKIFPDKNINQADFNIFKDADFIGGLLLQCSARKLLALPAVVVPFCDAACGQRALAPERLPFGGRTAGAARLRSMLARFAIDAAASHE